MGVNIFGFHTSVGGNMQGWGDHIRALDDAGIPAVIKPADDYGPCGELVSLARASGVPHDLGYRMTKAKGDNIELPVWTNAIPYNEAPAHWSRIKAVLPPEFDKEYVWLEVMNEPAKEFCFDTLEQLQASGLENYYREQYISDSGQWCLDNAEWLGVFACEIADLALADGYKLSLFGWSSGEPEYEHWVKPSMLNFLRKCALHKDRLSIALHEYSYDVDDIIRIK